MGHQPWLKFYPSDWRSDPKLRMCSLAARGLWIEMLALMHEANPRGHLLVNSIAPSTEQIGLLVGYGQVSELLSELENAGVFSRDENGVIYSRRMTRDEEKARICRENGSKGGRPKKPNENPEPNPNQNQKHKTQKPEARCQSKKINSPKRKRVSYPDDFEEFWKGYPTDANMAKTQAFDEWQRLDDADRKAATVSLEAFRYYCKRNPEYRAVHANRYLKQRRFDGHLRAVEEVREKTRPQVKLVRGSPPFEAWNAYRARYGKPKITQEVFWFDTEWPPGHPQNAKETA